MSYKCDFSTTQNEEDTSIHSADGFQEFNYLSWTMHIFVEQNMAVRGGNDNKPDRNVNISVALVFTDTAAERQRAQ